MYQIFVDYKFYKKDNMEKINACPILTDKYKQYETKIVRKFETCDLSFEKKMEIWNKMIARRIENIMGLPIEKQSKLYLEVQVLSKLISELVVLNDKE